MPARDEPRPYPNAPVDLAWLARHTETALEPELPIVDAHHHLWDKPGDRYLMEELGADLGSGHDVRASVFLQCGFAFRTDGPAELRPVGETAAVAALAEAAAGTVAGRPCAGIVGYADLRLGERVAAVLEAHREAGRGRFKGIRQSSSYDPAIVSSMTTSPPPGLLLDAAFRRGFAELGRQQLSFDAWLYHPQLGELTDLARAFPAVPIVVNHVGGAIAVGPYATRHAEVMTQWRASLVELARCQNVSVKLGGLARPVVGFNFHLDHEPPSSSRLAQAWRPFIEPCLEIFGPARCMFESNFPVDKAMCSYVTLWNSFKRLAAGCSASEKAALLHDTAKQFYRLDDAG